MRSWGKVKYHIFFLYNVVWSSAGSMIGGYGLIQVIAEKLISKSSKHTPLLYYYRLSQD